MYKPKAGDMIQTWFSGNKEGFSRILEVRPYDGMFRQDFKWFVKVTAPRTMAGFLEMAM